MILHSIGQYFSLRFYELGERFKHKPEMVSIFDHIRDASSVCIFSPNNKAELNAASIILTNLSDIFPNAKGLLFVPQDLNVETYDNAKFEIVKIDRQKGNIWGLPDSNMKDQLIAKDFDVLLDLSISFSFENTSLGWHCNAPLRVSFNHPKREKLYNFIVRLKKDAEIQNAFTTLVSFLGIDKKQIKTA
jgi:hypothetical protein